MLMEQGTRVECSDFGFVEKYILSLVFRKLESHIHLPAICCVYSGFSVCLAAVLHFL